MGEQKAAPATGHAAALPLRTHHRQCAPARELLRHPAHVLAAHPAHLRLLLVGDELPARDAGDCPQHLTLTPTLAGNPPSPQPYPSPNRDPNLTLTLTLIQASRAICLLSIHKNSLGAFLCLLSGFPDLITVVLLSRRPGMHQMAASNAFGSFAFNSCFSLGKPDPIPTPNQYPYP